MSKQMKSAYSLLNVKDAMDAAVSVTEIPMIFLIVIALALSLAGDMAFMVAGGAALGFSIAHYGFKVISIVAESAIKALGFSEVGLEWGRL